MTTSKPKIETSQRWSAWADQEARAVIFPLSGKDLASTIALVCAAIALTMF